MKQREMVRILFGSFRKSKKELRKDVEAMMLKQYMKSVGKEVRKDLAHQLIGRKVASEEERDSVRELLGVDVDYQENLKL